jgi:hypothetical protein
MSKDTHYEAPTVTKLGSLQELTLVGKNSADIDHAHLLPSVANP